MNIVNSLKRFLLSLILQINNDFTDEVMEDDWDNLIILDACRYDAFSEINYLDGHSEARMLRSSHSREYMKNHFFDDSLDDTIYITGNTHATKFIDNMGFHYVEYVELDDTNTRETEYTGPPEGHGNTVLPEDVVQKAIEAHSRFPNKKIVVHFMQPHLPFIGEYGNELYTRALNEASEAGIDITRDWSHSTIDIWKAIRTDGINITEDEAWEAYCENLEIVLGYAEQLHNELDGKTVLTSDHGELLGEQILGKKRYGHPHDVRAEKLNQVPWHVMESQVRREIISETPKQYGSIDDTTVREQLQALGYQE